MELVPCEGCKRHVAVGERACPFCGRPGPRVAPARPRLGGRISRAAVFASATLASCHPQPSTSQDPPPPPPPDDTQQVVVASVPPVDAPPPPPPVDAPPVTAAPVDTPPPPVETATAVIIGRVRTAAGTAIGGVHVQVVGPDDFRKETYTNATGTFTLRELAKGRYRLTLVWTDGVSNPRHDPPQRQVIVQLADGATEKLEIRFAEPEPLPIDRGPCCKPYGAPPARRRLV